MTEKTFDNNQTSAPLIKGRGKTDLNVSKKNPNLVRKKPSKYFNVNDLQIPEEVEDRFKRDGFVLRYVRFIKPGTTADIDYQNVGKKIQQGFTFVPVQEAPEIALTSFKQDINVVGADNGVFKDVIVKGDVALMKVPLENVQERREELARLNTDIMAAVETDARKNKLFSQTKTSYGTYQRNRGQDVSFGEDE